MATISKSTYRRWQRKLREMPSKPYSSLFSQRRLNRMRGRKEWRRDLFHQLILSKVFISTNFNPIFSSIDLKKY
jgi:hypothetical protein